VIQETRLVLVGLLAHASSAARILGHLGDRDGSTALEQLSDHVDTLAHGLSELIGAFDRTMAEHAIPPMAHIGADGGAP
jgi:hypothetical protein